jgi:hypothetical protein
MHAQLTYFDGPLSPERVAAADRAGRERILPTIRSLGHPVRLYLLQRADGSTIVLTIAESEQVLLDIQKAIMTTELQADEDPALLPGPDRIELYPVLETHELSGSPA